MSPLRAPHVFQRSGGFPTPTPTGDRKVPSYPPNSGPTGAQRKQPQRRGGQECPPSGCPMFSKEWGFSYPHSHAGTGKPPLLSAQLRPHRSPAKATAAKRGTRMSLLRASHVFQWSGGFPTPTPTGGLESPPSYPPNSGPTGAQRKQPQRRGGQECPPSGRPMFSKEWGFSYPHSHGGTGMSPLPECVHLFFQEC